MSRTYKQGLNVLSLFDGGSCGQVALNRAGIPVNQYFASEIDKYAISVTQKNHPNTVQLGSVVDVQTKNQMLVIPHDDGNGHAKIDLLIGGSPCQDFSFAGKQKGFNGDRGALFFEYVRLLKELKPRYFLLENVRMRQDNEQAITEYLAEAGYPCEPRHINSNLVSAQNRYRLYWTNIPDTGMPDDKGIVLQDILETGFTDRDKAYCIDANYFKGGNLRSYFSKNRRQLVFDVKKGDTGLLLAGEADINGHDLIKRVYYTEGKSPTLNAVSGGNQEPKILCGAWRGRYTVDGVRQDHKQATAGLTTQRLEVRRDGKTNTISTVQKDNVAVRIDTDDVTIDDLRWRKLTVKECERLQTLPDDYTAGVSNTQRYKICGNGWTVDVVAHIFNGLKG